MKKVIPLVFALSVIAGPSLAWGWGGEGGCSYSKDNNRKQYLRAYKNEGKTKYEPVTL